MERNSNSPCFLIVDEQLSHAIHNLAVMIKLIVE